MAKLVSKVYGDALFETAMENDKVEVLYEEAGAIVTILNENPEWKTLFSNPRIVKEEKTSILNQLFSGKIEEELMGFLTLVVEKDRQGELIPILEYFIQRVREYKKIGTAYVSSAVDLNDEQKARIEKKLLETTDYVSLEMHYQTDGSLIGGMVIRIGDHVADSSIKSKLYGLKRELTSLQLV